MSAGTLRVVKRRTLLCHLGLGAIFVLTLLAACAEPNVGPLANEQTTPADGGNAAVPVGGAGDGGDADPALPQFPRTAAEADLFLRGRGYKGWTHASAPYQSQAILHRVRVIPYLNPILEASLAAGATQHPLNSMSVKEFVDEGGNVIGWAFSHKTKAASEGGSGWYWYQVFSTEPGATPSSGDGLGSCTSCHVDGKDFVLSRYPLQP